MQLNYEYLDFSDDLKNLKEFLSLRDSSPVFEEIRKKGKIGIPCILSGDGTLSFDWERFMIGSALCKSGRCPDN